MIAMLEILPDERGEFFKRLDYIIPRKITARLLTAGDIQMLSVTHRRHVRGIGWRKLEEITAVRDWLLPKGIVPPSGSAIKGFKPKRLPARFLENVAIAALKNADIKPSALSVGIYPHSESTALEPVLEHAREVHILCDSNNEELAQDIMDKYGAAIIIGNNDEIFSGCQMVIASDDCTGHAKADKNALLFSPAENQRHSLHVHSTLPQSPEIYSYPSRLFGSLKVLSALYELENRSELAQITPALSCIDGGLITTTELSAYLKTLAL